MQLTMLINMFLPRLTAPISYSFAPTKLQCHAAYSQWKQICRAVLAYRSPVSYAITGCRPSVGLGLPPVDPYEFHKLAQILEIDRSFTIDGPRLRSN